MVKVARNLGNNAVEHWIFSDPYRALNFITSYCGNVSAVIKCSETYTVGGEKNCWNCPLAHHCVCENYSLTSPSGRHFETVVIDNTKF